MSDARKILDERLAKGEITEAEYDRLVTKIAGKPDIKPTTDTPEPKPQTTPTVDTAPTDSSEISPQKVLINVGIFAVIMVGLFIYNRSNEWNGSANACARNGIFKTEAGCSCFAEKAMDRTPQSLFIPILGGLLFKPSDAEAMEIASAAIQICRYNNFK